MIINLILIAVSLLLFGVWSLVCVLFGALLQHRKAVNQAPPGLASFFPKITKSEPAMDVLEEDDAQTPGSSYTL
jgi:hypothetical protein